ncbi:MAG: hypothetical protein WD080_11255 [Egibacteraceae bacterium]
MGAQAEDRDPRMPTSTRLLWGLGAVVAVALLAAALAGTLREPASLPAGTPEATVQAYVAAVLDGDVERATALLVDDLARNCRERDFRVTLPEEPLTVTLDDVRVRDDRAEVTVRLDGDADEPLLPIFESVSRQHFTLVRQRNRWVIAEDPWPVYFCHRLQP